MLIPEQILSDYCSVMTDSEKNGKPHSHLLGIGDDAQSRIPFLEKHSEVKYVLDRLSVSSQFIHSRHLAKLYLKIAHIASLANTPKLNMKLG